MFRIRNSWRELENGIRRYFSSSSASIPQETIRNIGILAHIDAGDYCAINELS